MNFLKTSAMLALASAPVIVQRTFSSAPPNPLEKVNWSHLPIASRAPERVPNWPNRASYRAQVRNARRRRNIQKRGGAQ